MGACSFSVGHGASMLKKVSSVKMLHQAPNAQNVTSYPLKRRVCISTLISCFSSVSFWIFFFFDTIDCYVFYFSGATH